MKLYIVIFGLLSVSLPASSSESELPIHLFHIVREATYFTAQTLDGKTKEYLSFDSHRKTILVDTGSQYGVKSIPLDSGRIGFLYLLGSHEPYEVVAYTHDTWVDGRLQQSALRLSNAFFRNNRDRVVAYGKLQEKLWQEQRNSTLDECAMLIRNGFTRN